MGDDQRGCTTAQSSLGLGKGCPSSAAAISASRARRLRRKRQYSTAMAILTALQRGGPRYEHADLLGVRPSRGPRSAPSLAPVRVEYVVIPVHCDHQLHSLGQASVTGSSHIAQVEALAPVTYQVDRVLEALTCSPSQAESVFGNPRHSAAASSLARVASIHTSDSIASRRSRFGGRVQHMALTAASSQECAPAGLDLGDLRVFYASWGSSDIGCPPSLDLYAGSWSASPPGIDAMDWAFDPLPFLTWDDANAVLCTSNRNFSQLSTLAGGSQLQRVTRH